MIQRSIFTGLWLLTALFGASSKTSVRIKELASIEGVRDNQLIGYGLIVGLNVSFRQACVTKYGCHR